jgi:predicted Zn-dependent protease
MEYRVPMHNHAKAAILTLLLTCVSGIAGANAKSKMNEQSASQSADATRFRQMLNDLSAEQAEQEIDKYLKTNVDDAAVREVHAESLYKLGRYHFAVDELKRAMQTRTDQPEDALLMGKICQSMHKPKEAVVWYKNLSP